MAISGPIALYSNPPIEPQYFAPWNFAISNIAIGTTTTVTLVIPSITQLNYVIGQQVRFHIPVQFGCRQINGLQGYVIDVIPPNQVIVDLNSQNADPYISTSARTSAQLSAIGDINTGQISSTGRNIPLVTIPGAFINISPN
jgi:hypothetical protein